MYCMRIITEIAVENFRSLQKIELTNLQGFNAFAGLNNAGKSNILKSLNAFFNDETTKGIPLTIEEDFTRLEKPTKKRKTSQFPLNLNYPKISNFKKPLKALRNYLRPKISL